MTNTIIFDTRREDDSSSSSSSSSEISQQFDTTVEQFDNQPSSSSSTSVYSALRRKIRSWIRPRSDSILEDLGIENKPHIFSYAELRTATEDFRSKNKLGNGGFGSVYKGTLSDGKEIAVKKLAKTSYQGKEEFFAEISALSKTEHRNLVKLYGCCIGKANRLIVYEYLENKSLDQALFGNPKLHLNWTARFNICIGVARGLTYLHEESKPRIIHRDVKARNILLDLNLIPKISDFGLAKLYDDEQTHISTQVKGTLGYLAPEYFMRSHLTEKADVFSFGVVALEILCGRSNYDLKLDPERKNLLDWAWNLYENNRELELMDPTLTAFNKEEAIRMLKVSLLCTQVSSTRPLMSRVVAMLSGDIDVDPVTQRPSYLTDGQANDMSGFESEDGSLGSPQTVPHGELLAICLVSHTFIIKL